MAVYTFKADPDHPDDVFATTLTVVFDRGSTATLNPDGSAVASDEARFDREVLIAAVPEEYEHVFSGGGILFCVGVDATGDEVMVYGDHWAGPLYVFYGGTITLGGPPFPGEANAITLSQRFADPDPLLQTSYYRGLEDFFDILGNAQTVGALGMDVYSVVVFHGAIIIGGPVWVCVDDQSNPPLWEIEGWGFGINTSLGTGAWSHLWHDDPGDVVQRYKRRGQVWCLRAAPVYERDTAVPDRCAIVSSDYINKRDTSKPHDTEAESGRAYYFHIVRDTGDDPPGDWNIQRDGLGGAMVMPFDVWPPGMKRLNHVHCAMATEWTGEEESQGVQVLFCTGDGKGAARFIHASLDDIDGDYADPGNWTVTDDFHGVGDTLLDPDPPISMTSPQPVCAAFAPVEGVMFWGADLGTETLFATRLPADANEVQQARFDHLYGWGTSSGTNSATGSVFNLTQPRPELTGGEGNENPIVACYMEAESLAGQDRDADRVLYCPDSAEPELWAQVGRMHGSTSNQNAAKYGEYIYFGAYTYGLKRIPLPKFSEDTLVRMRPVLVGCGGRNMVKAECVHSEDEEDGVLFSLETFTSGHWVDDTVSPSVELPVVASLGDRLIKVRTSNTDNTGYAGRIRPSSDDPNDFNTLTNWTWVNATQVRRFRGWLLDGTYNKGSASPSLLPNKTSQTCVRNWDEGAVLGGCPIRYSASNKWSPLTNISVMAINVARGFGLRLNARDNGNDAEVDENYEYLLIDMALDGNGAIPYPLPPETEGPDELLTLSGFALGTDHDWHLKLAGMMPVGNWDRFAARETFNGSGVSDRRWPLWTLWADDENWIEFVADCEAKFFTLHVCRDGTTTPYSFGSLTSPPAAESGNVAWTPDSPLLVALSFDVGTGKLYVGASLGGFLVQFYAEAIEYSEEVTFTELRFRGAPGGGFSGEGEVCEFRWCGGLIDDETSIANAGMPGAFTDLGFLVA